MNYPIQIKHHLIVRLIMNRRQISLLISLVFVILTGSTLTQTLNQFQSESQSFNQIIGTVLGSYSHPETEYYTVTKIIDGDTLKISNNGQELTIRLVGIDTPETVAPGKEVECYGPQASDMLSQLIADSPVRIEHDSIQPELDRYGRTLAYLYTQDGTFINAQMIKLGFARAYTKADSLHLPYFIQLENEARAKLLGLWSHCPQF